MPSIRCSAGCTAIRWPARASCWFSPPSTSACSPSSFFTARNLSTILAQVTIIGTLAVAQTLVVLTAGIDLSVGSITVLSSVVMGKLALGWGYQPVLALLIGIAIGTACGFLNGTLVTRLRIPPFIATLGTFNALFALSQWFSENETLRNQDLKAQASILLWFDHTWEPIERFRVTYGSLLMLALFVVGVVPAATHGVGPPRLCHR